MNKIKTFDLFSVPPLEDVLTRNGLPLSHPDQKPMTEAEQTEHEGLMAESSRIIAEVEQLRVNRPPYVPQPRDPKFWPPRRDDVESRSDYDVEVYVEGHGQMRLWEFFREYGFDKEDRRGSNAREDRRMAIRHAMDAEYVFTDNHGDLRMVVAVPKGE